MGKWYHLSGIDNEAKPVRASQVKHTDQEDVVLYEKRRYPLIHQTARHRVYCTIIGDVFDLNELHLENDHSFMVRTPALVYTEKSEDVAGLENFFQYGTFNMSEGNEHEEARDNEGDTIRGDTLQDDGGDTTRERSRGDDDSQTMEEVEDVEVDFTDDESGIEDGDYIDEE